MSEISKTARPYFPQLDGVRAIAALLVMAFHFCQAKGVGGITIIGQTGVDLFFVLSGFLITTILLLATPNDWHEVRTFYIRRSLRIFPLYYGYLFGAFLLGATVSPWYWIYLENIFIALHVHIAGPNHFWSLAVEEQFYLLWPFLVLFLPRRWLGKALVLILAISTLCYYYLAHSNSNVEAFYFTASRLDGLAAGGLLALLSQEGWLKANKTWALALIGLSGVFLIAHLWKTYTYSHVSVTVFYASSVAYLVVSGDTIVNRLFAARPLRFVGRISYGLYVFHPAIFRFALAHTREWIAPLQLLACVAATFVVTLLSWYCVESQFLKLKDRLAPERTPFDRSAGPVFLTP